ncbi:MAG: hypothetical protein GC204_02465 [Chloroflexi bacterium]|nr:hypothetical protein [Chloroflexota bacterium]
MPRRSKAEKKRLLAVDIAYRVAGLAGLGVFLLILFNNPGDKPVEFQNNIISATIVFMVVFVIIYFPLYAILKFIFVPKTTPTFDFNESPVSKRGRAYGVSASKRERATEFEHDVASLIYQITGRRTEVVGGSGDGGIDIKVYENGKWIGIVQCKNLAPGKFVYPSYIRDLNTVKHYHQVRTAYLVSTGLFSDSSRQLAKDLGVRLIDGNELKQLRRKAIAKSQRPDPSQVPANSP